MFQTYEQIFRQRADAYQKAMELYPAARDREFQLAVSAADIRPGDVVCDAPSGGGYLRAYLPDGVQHYLAVETATEFTGHCQLGENDRVVRSPLTRLDLDDGSVDVCINLACVKSVTRGVEEILGCISGPGKINLAWPLRYIAAVKF